MQKPQGIRFSAMAVSNLQNDGLKWERTSSWNVGFDFAFFNSRLSGSVDVYQKKPMICLFRVH